MWVSVWLGVLAIISCIKNINELGTKFFIPERKEFLYELLLLLREKNEKLIQLIDSGPSMSGTDKDLIVYLFHFQTFAKILKPLYTYPSSLIIVEEIEKITQKLTKDIVVSTQKETLDDLKKLQESLRDLLLVTHNELKKYHPARSY